MHIRALSILQQQLNTLFSQLDVLHSQDYAEDSPKEFIENIEKELRELSSEINSATSSLLSDHPDRLLVELRTFQKEICLISGRVEFIRNAKFDFLPWSAVSMISRLASEIAPKQPVMVSGSLTSATYKIYPPSNSFGTIAVLQIPHLYKRTSLLHVLVAHELFHLRAEEVIDNLSGEILVKLKKLWAPSFIAERNQLEEREKNRPESDSDQLDWVQDALEIKTEKNESELLEHTRTIWKRIFTEIYCDIGCTYVFGPAALFALQDVLLLHNDATIDAIYAVNSIHKYHPPVSQRLKYMLDFLNTNEKLSDAENQLIKFLQEGTFNNYADAYNTRINSVRSDIQSAPRIPSDPKLAEILRIANIVVEANVKKIWEHVAQVGKNISSSWVGHVDEVVFHLGNFGNSIPSGTIIEDLVGIKPAAHGAIGLAAWIKYLADIGECKDPSQLPDLMTRQQADGNILLKSWDDAETVRRFRELSE